VNDQWAVPLIEWWRRRRLTRPRVAAVVRCISHADVPKRLNPRRIYAVGSGPDWAMLRCPCGQGHDLTIDIATRWRLGTGKPSLYPSVWDQSDRGCHFWLRSGRVEWCPKGGRE